MEMIMDDSNHEEVVRELPRQYEKHANRRLNGIRSYTGPQDKYAVVGIGKERPGSTLVTKGFKKVHVYSLVLLNIEAIHRKHIEYKPWPVFEDLTLNCDSEKNELWVVKMYRFSMKKRHLLTWLPDIFYWDALTELKRGEEKAEKSEEERILLSWLRLHVSPRNVDVWPPLNEKNLVLNGMTSLYNQLMKKLNGKNQIVLISPNPAHKFRTSNIVGYFRKFVGHRMALSEKATLKGKFALILPFDYCLNKTTLVENPNDVSLVRKQIFRTEIVDKAFEKVDTMEVLSSHAVMQNQTSFVVLYVEGHVKRFMTLMESSDLSLNPGPSTSALQLPKTASQSKTKTKDPKQKPKGKPLKRSKGKVQKSDVELEKVDLNESDISLSGSQSKKPKVTELVTPKVTGSPARKVPKLHQGSSDSDVIQNTQNSEVTSIGNIVYERPLVKPGSDVLISQSSTARNSTQRARTSSPYTGEMLFRDLTVSDDGTNDARSESTCSEAPSSTQGSALGPNKVSIVRNTQMADEADATRLSYTTDMLAEDLDVSEDRSSDNASSERTVGEGIALSTQSTPQGTLVQIEPGTSTTDNSQSTPFDTYPGTHMILGLKNEKVTPTSSGSKQSPKRKRETNVNESNTRSNRVKSSTSSSLGTRANVFSQKDKRTQQAAAKKIKPNPPNEVSADGEASADESNNDSDSLISPIDDNQLRMSQANRANTAGPYGRCSKQDLVNLMKQKDKYIEMLESKLKTLEESMRETGPNSAGDATRSRVNYSPQIGQLTSTPISQSTTGNHFNEAPGTSALPTTNQITAANPRTTTHPKQQSATSSKQPNNNHCTQTNSSSGTTIGRQAVSSTGQSNTDQLEVCNPSSGTQARKEPQRSGVSPITNQSGKLGPSSGSQVDGQRRHPEAASDVNQHVPNTNQIGEGLSGRSLFTGASLLSVAQLSELPSSSTTLPITTENAQIHTSSGNQNESRSTQLCLISQSGLTGNYEPKSGYDSSTIESVSQNRPHKTSDTVFKSDNNTLSNESPMALSTQMVNKEIAKKHGQEMTCNKGEDQPGRSNIAISSKKGKQSSTHSRKSSSRAAQSPVMSPKVGKKISSAESKPQNASSAKGTKVCANSERQSSPSRPKVFASPSKLISTENAQLINMLMNKHLGSEGRSATAQAERADPHLVVRQPTNNGDQQIIVRQLTNSGNQHTNVRQPANSGLQHAIVRQPTNASDQNTNVRQPFIPHDQQTNFKQQTHSYDQQQTSTKSDEEHTSVRQQTVSSDPNTNVRQPINPGDQQTISSVRQPTSVGPPTKSRNQYTEVRRPNNSGDQHNTMVKQPTNSGNQHISIGGTTKSDESNPCNQSQRGASVLVNNTNENREQNNMFKTNIAAMGHSKVLKDNRILCGICRQEMDLILDEQASGYERITEFRITHFDGCLSNQNPAESQRNETSERAELRSGVSANVTLSAATHERCGPSLVMSADEFPMIKARKKRRAVAGVRKKD